MKWVIFAAALLATVPAGFYARGRERVHQILLGLVAFIPFIEIDRFAINAFSNEAYRGESRGFETTIVDLLAITLFVALPAAKNPPPFRPARYFYLAVAALSIAFADMPLYSCFSVWKILRCYFVCVVVGRALENPNLGPWLLNGFGAGILYCFGRAIEQRYILHFHQVQAAFPHPNSLGMAVNLVFPVALALLMAGQGGKLAIGACATAAVVVIMTLSRGGLMMFGAASAVVFLGSLYRGVTKRKLYVVISAFLGTAVVLAYSLDSIIERFLNAPEASVGARTLFNKGAQMMLDDHPLGVGINNYSYMLANAGYARDLQLPLMDYGAIAHHIYWLTLAEMGYLGLVAYALLLLWPLWYALRGALRAKGDVRGDILLGLTAGLLVTYIQGFAEWIARQTPMMYLFYIVIAAVWAFSQQLEQERAAADSAATG